MKKVVILTEGGQVFGFGHITRCTSFYQAFQEVNVIPEFIVNGDESVSILLSDKKHRVIDWLKRKEYLLDILHDVDILIVDSYHVEKEFYTEISDIVKIPVYLDDNMRLDYPRGYVINGTIYAENLNYPPSNDVKYLLGPEYAYLRKEFWNVPLPEIKQSIHNVMITIGGTDKRNLTSRILRLMSVNFPHLKKFVVVGNSDSEKYTYLDNNTKLISQASAGEMKDVMIQSDIAITAAGQTTYELCRMGVPMIALETAENQKKNIDSLFENGLILKPIRWNCSTLEEDITNQIISLESYLLRVEISKKMMSIIDGNGARSIVEILNNSI